MGSSVELTAAGEVCALQAERLGSDVSPLDWNRAIHGLGRTIQRTIGFWNGFLLKEQ